MYIQGRASYDELHKQVEARLALLSDERMVLKVFAAWPEARVEALRECVGRAAELRRSLLPYE